MSKLLVVFGCTGQQGGSVVDFVLNDPALSKEFTIRGITRDPSSKNAATLKERGIELVQADANDGASLNQALRGAHTVFAMTASVYGPGTAGKELAQGKAIADAAVAAGAKYIIFSTLPYVKEISGGKYTRVYGFDEKAEAEQYIRSLPIKSAFFSPGSFMQNFMTMGLPRPDGQGGYAFARHISPQTQLPLIDTAGDTGKYVGTILAEPDKYEGKVFCAATALYSLDDMADIMTKATGKQVRYQQVSEEQFRQYLPQWSDAIVEMMLYQEEFGYYGPQTKELVAWAAENARGKVHTFEEYLKENPLPLQ